MKTPLAFPAFRKAALLLLACVMLLALTACGNAPASSAPVNDPDPTLLATTMAEDVTASAPITNGDNGSDKNPSYASGIPSNHKNIPSITEVASDYLSGAGLLTDYYGELESGWIYVSYDVEMGSPYHRICPAAVFPDEEWTPETVLQSYLDKTANWQPGLDPVAVLRYYLWSSDFDYIFTIEDGWLEINYVKALPFDCETRSDLSPLALLKEYQSGKWNSEDPLWSEDYSTYVKRWSEGTLKYFYSNPMDYDEPREYAYDGCDKNPWWNGLNEIQGFPIRTGVYDNQCVEVPCYLDLPDGKIDDGIDSLVGLGVWDQGDTGTWLTTETGVYHYLRGKLLDSWQLEMDPTTSYIATQNSSNSFDANYAYTGTQLVKLLPGSRTQVVLDNASADTGYEGSFWAYYVENRSLKRWVNWNGGIVVDTLIEGDVIRISGASPIFVEKADGYVYAVQDSYHYQKEVTPTFVGGETLDYYVDKWNEYRSSDRYDLTDFVVSYGETHFPRSERRSLDVANAVFGQRVDIRSGATYYASADLAGSGASAEVYNIYTEGPLYLGGFAIVNNGRLADYEAYLRDDVKYATPAPTFCQDVDGELWCFIYVDGYTTGSIGWFLADDLYYVDPSGPVIIAHAKEPVQDAPATAPSVEPSDSQATPAPDRPVSVFEDRTETTSDEVASNIKELATAGEKVAVLLDASGSVRNYSAAIANYAAQVDTADTVIMFGGSAKTITADTYAKESSTLGWNFPFFGSAGSTNVYAALNSVPAGDYDTVILVSDLLSRSFDLTERTDIDSIVIIYVGDTDDMGNLDKSAQGVVDAITEKWGITPIIQQLVTE